MKKVFLAIAALASVVVSASAETQVIAHRGYWNCEGSAQNSITALRKSAECGFYGSEFDVLITKDGVLVVNHDDTIEGIDIQSVNYKEIKNIELPNGEKIPTLEQYLVEGKSHPELKLILELKPLRTKEVEDKAVAGVIKLLKKLDLWSQVEIISFSMNICEGFVAAGISSPVSYLMSDVTPSVLKEKGIAGFDYYYKVLLEKKEWFNEAQECGLTTNAWTINDLGVAKTFIEEGIDYITTDYPEEVSLLISRTEE